MVLSAIGSDQALAAQAFKRAGARWLDGYSSAFAGILRLGSRRASWRPTWSTPARAR
jgi:hypothetical protein